MKILFCSSGLKDSYGGPPVSEATLASSLRRYGEVTVLCRETKFDRAFAARFGIPELVSFSSADTIKAFFSRAHRLNALFASHDIFHLNGHWRWENFFLTRLAHRHRVPYVFHPRGMLLLGHRKIFIKKIFNFFLGNIVVRQADRVIALSEFETRHFRPYHLRKDQIAVVPNPVLLPKAGKSETSAKQKRYFLYLGRIEGRKNLLWLIDAFELFFRSGGNAELRLVGPIEHGYGEVVGKYIDDKHLHDVVTLGQPVYGDAKWGLLAGALGVIYPAREEAFGRVPFETLAAGSLPVIPKESGASEYLKSLIPECIYLEETPGALAAILTKLAEMEPETLRLRQEKAANWVRENLDPATNAKVMFQLYEGTLRSTGS